jgi:phospholipid-translocating ATPase
MDRFHRRAEARDGKRRSTAANSTAGAPLDPLPDNPGNRKVYVNVPLPESERDEDGHPMANYPRNKVRTAKYTPITFVPKNLWFQFQNIANIYFLFIIILSVRSNISSQRYLLVFRLSKANKILITSSSLFLVSIIPL